MYHPFKKLIEANRQTGTTTALIRAVRETKGYLIVGNEYIKKAKLSDNKDLVGHIFSIHEVETGKLYGLVPGTLFFDTDAIWLLTNTIDRSQIGDGYSPPKIEAINEDGYAAKCDKQINVKLTDEDIQTIKGINADFFENEASSSMLARCILRRGFQFYKKMKESF
jgi:hypothetical protein